MPTPVERRQERGQLVTQMRAIQAKADGEKRAMTPEEAQEFDRIDAAQEAIRAELAADEQRRSRLAAIGNEPTPGPSVRPSPAPEPRGESRLAAQLEALGLSPSYRAALLRRGDEVASDAYDQTFRSFMANGDLRAAQTAIESRTTLQVDVFTKGGALQAPTLWVAQLIKGVDDLTFARQYATRIPVLGAASLGAVTLDGDVDDFDWTSEIKAVTEDTGLKFGKRELKTNPLTKEVKVSNDLLRKVPAAEGLVRDRLAYKYGITWEKAVLTGTGVRGPLGVFTASPDGIPTSRDVSTGNTTTSIGADGLIETKHSIKSAYWAGLRWAFHRDAVKQIRKLKDGNGQYLWAPGLSGGIPDRILEHPYDVSEHVPNTFASGLYVGILAYWPDYWIADSVDLSIQVVDQLYARTRQTGFIGHGEGDGQPVRSEGFARVKLA
ncbi:MAG: phage major capsid protein [Vicinamibacteria bacterium]|nr:phage major capsid protein [Vicinamibacteria bacterium]